MKFYSHNIYKQHLEDLKSFKDDDKVRQAFMDWPRSIANTFDRSYPRVGILDLNDLVQEGYCAFYKAWKDLNWGLIMDKPKEDRPALITSYLKRRIKDRVVRAIARDRDAIRVPEHYYMAKFTYGFEKEKAYQTDIFLTRTFSSFFDQSVLDQADENLDYVSDELNEMLNDFMDRVLNPIEKNIVKMFYGIDEAYDKPVSQARIAEYNSQSVSNIKVLKHRAINKLKDNKKLIEKKYHNIVTN